MKKIIASILSAFLNLTLNAATWTIHGAMDNTAYASIGSNDVCLANAGTLTCGSEWIAGCTFDYWNDQQYPEFADSGSDSSVLQLDGSYLSIGRVVGWQESYTLIIGTASPNGPIDFLSASMTTYAGVGGPNWENWQEAILPGVPGEFWIDFAPDGSCRISSTQPIDFGKWAWDGSINPSWTAAKKGFAKGHNKQPLPSPK